MSNKKGKLILPEEFKLAIKDSYILLDTNIFINLLITPSLFLELIDFLKSNNTELMTIDLCKLEFLMGSSNLDEYQKREEIFNQFDIAIIPTRDCIDLFDKMIKAYRREGADVSIVDMFLATVLLRYSSSLQKILLLTTNYKDFPENIFERTGIALISKPKQIFPLVALKLNKEAINKSLSNF